MPGRNEDLSESIEMASAHNVNRVVRLAPLDEVRDKSPDYFQALLGEKIPWQDIECAVPDYGIPADEDLFVKTVQRVADWLRSAENVLVHCGAGKGRTGMFAICVLVALGISLELAERNVRAADSGPETPEQHAFLQRIIIRLRR
jgi:protein-tyrosine phosphatase